MKVDKASFSKMSTDSRREIKENASRDLASEKEKKFRDSRAKDVENQTEIENKQKIQSFKQNLEKMEDDLDSEWKKLFKDISNFERNIFN